jgi:hypothetical protein
LAVSGLASAQASNPEAPRAPLPTALFAVEFRMGPKWDTSRPPGEQAHFADHSANLKRVREAGSLLLGARYSDKGLVVLAADSESSARAMIDADASVQNQVFVYELHKFSVFYPGCVARQA